MTHILKGGGENRMKRRTASIFIIFLVLLNFNIVQASSFRATGYYPFTCEKHERKMEGGKNDRYGNRLRTLQDYKDGSYVSVATDPKIVKSGSILSIEEFPDIKFLACDVGRAIKGKKIDIAVRTRKDAYKLPKYLTVRVIKNESPRDKERREFLDRICSRALKGFKNSITNTLQELERNFFDEKDNSGLCMVRNDRISSDSAVFTSRMGHRKERLQRFCHR